MATTQRNTDFTIAGNNVNQLMGACQSTKDDVNHIVCGMESNIGSPHYKLNDCDINQKKRSYGTDCSIETIFGDVFDGSTRNKLIDLFGTNPMVQKKVAIACIEQGTKIMELNEKVRDKWPQLQFAKYKEELYGSVTPTKNKSDLDFGRLLKEICEIAELSNDGKDVDMNDLIRPQWFSFGFNNETHDKISELSEAVRNGIKTVHKIELGGVVKAYLIIALATSALIFAGKRRYFLSVLSTIGLSLVANEDISEAVTKFIDYFKVKPQDGTTDFEPLINLSIMALGLKNVIKGNTKEFTNVVSNYGRLSTGGANMFSDILDIVEKIVNLFRDKVLGKDKIKFFNDCSDEIQKWIDDIDEISKLLDRNKYTIDCTNYDKVLLLKGLGDRFFKEVSKAGKEFISLKGVISLYQKKVSDILIPFKKASLDATAQRTPPLCVLLQGESGVGKSAMTVPFIDDILVSVIQDADTLRRFEESHMDFIYSRNYETKFWDGYRGQMVCVFDDFMQNVENLGDADGEPMNLIRAVNPFPYQLHMAHLDDKGNNYFSSKLIVATTNDYNLNSMIIKKPEALKRRFEIVLEVYPKKEYCVDPNVTLRERRLRVLEDFTFDVYEFHVKTDKLGLAGGHILGYDECVNFVSDAYNKRMCIGNAYLTRIGSRRSAKVKQRLAQLDVKAQSPSLYQQFKIKRELEKYIPRTEQVKARDEIEDIFAKKLCYYRTDFMQNFWKSSYGASYLIYTYRPVVAMDKIDKMVTFSKEFRGYCNFKDIACTIPKRFDDVYLARYPVDPQAGEYMMDHTCPDNMEVFLTTLYDHKEGKLAKVDAEQLALKLLNDGNPCKCAHFDTAVELLMDSSTKSKYSVSSLLDSAKGLFKRENAFPALVGIASIIITMKAAMSLYSMWGGVEEYANKTFAQYGEGKTSHSVRSLKSYKIAPIVKAQSGENVEISEKKIKHIDSLVKKNIYVAYVDGVSHPWAYVTAIKGDVFMLNAHYYKLLVSKRKLGMPLDIMLVPYTNVLKGDVGSTFHVNGNNLIEQYPPTETMIQNDVWLFNITNMRPHRDITDSFITEAELKVYKEEVPIISTYLRKTEDENIVALCQQNAKIFREELKNDDLHMTTFLRTNFESEDGDCGSLVMLNDKGTNSDKIVSMHAALAVSRFALSTVITKELIVSILPSTTSVLPQNVDPDFEYDDNGLLKVDLPHRYYRPEKSRLRKSPFFGTFGEPKRSIAALSKSGQNDPYEKAIARYGTGNFHVDERTLRYAADHYSQQLRKMKFDNKEILGMEAAIKGISGEPYVNGVCRSTSPGYPWNLKGTGGKWHLFGRDMDYDITNEECKKLMIRCNEIIDNAKKGVRMQHYYIDALKDELRPNEKVENFKTRMISCAPVDYVIVVKMYFGSFVSCFLQNRLYNGSAVGINAVSDEWTKMVKLAMSVGKNMIAGDFSSFDATQSASTLRAILRIINDWYDDGEENAKIREILWLEVHNSVHTHGDKAIMLDHSLPSGHPLTTIINTIYVNVVIRMAFINCYNNPAVLEQFDRHVFVIAYGDDSLLSVSKEALEDFNYQTIEEALSKFGLTYTNEDKTNSEVSSKPIEDCTFLKRGFRYEGGQWQAPLDLDVVSEMWYWYRQGPDEKQRVKDNVVNMLRELSLHDSDTWMKLIPIIKEQTREHDMDLISYDQDFYKASLIASERDIMDMITNDGIKVQSGESVDAEQSKEMAGTEQGDEVSNDLTKFVSDTVVREYELNPYTDIANGLKSAPNVFPQDDVKQFLGRPIKIATFSMASTDAAGTTLWSHVIPPDDFYNSVSPLWRNKISGFMGIRGTAVLRFVVAANRFVQGRLLVHYLPGPVDSDWEKQHNRNLMTRTQQPRIDININRDTAAEIRFPYISPATHYDVLAKQGKWGKIFATVYSPLVGYTGQLNISVFLHFEDIDLVLPTIAPQSGRFREKEALGPVSSVLDVSAKVANVLKGVPSLSALATPAAWFLSYAKKTAQSLGYAVANNRDHYLRVGLGENAYSLNNDGQRIAFPMSNSNQNEVEVLTGFAGSDIDEMSLKYFAQRAAFFYSSVFDTSHITGDNIHTNTVGPLFYNELVADFSAAFLPGSVYTMAPVSFLAAASSYWRGSLVFNFKLVKTEFHTGKLAICFFPGVTSAQSDSQTNWTFRHVVDIKDTDEFHITVPYTSLTPWSRNTDRTGSLQIFVVNPLNAPPTVSNSISLLLEVSGGDDFAVAGITDFGGAPFTQTDFVPQSGLFKDDIRIKKFVIGDAEVKERSVDAERYSIGEAMVSVKHFTNKFKRCLGGPVAMNNPAGPYRSMTFRPFTIGGMVGTFSTKVITPSSLGNSWVDLFSSCYSIARGSMYYDFYSTETANWINYGFNSLYTGVNRPAFAYAALGASIVNTPGNQIVIDGKAAATTGHVIVNTPQWAMGHSRYVRCDNTDGARALYAYEPSLYLTATNAIVNVVFKRSKLFKASGDDFQLGGFVGVPAMYIYGNILEPVNPDIGV